VAAAWQRGPERRLDEQHPQVRGIDDTQRVRPEVQWTLDAIIGAAAFVGNDRLDLLAANQRERVADWCVATLRWAVGRDPHDRDLSDLVGELATHSAPFRTRWAAHDVRFHNVGVKHFHHPVVGDLSLSLTRLDLPADRGLTIFAYTAEPGSRAEEALKLLGSWAATAEPAESAHATDQS
jgi:hypothetical protein